MTTAHARRLNGAHGTWCSVSMAEAHAAGDWVSEDGRKVTCPDCNAATAARFGLGAQRPSSIIGGVRYDPEPMGGRPVSLSYVVCWRDGNGTQHYVSSPPQWRGPMTPTILERFRRRIERSMATFPPI